jgi:tetratricopeptide (TPR) repeat protein
MVLFTGPTKDLLTPSLLGYFREAVLVYQDTGQPQQALALYEQTLPIMREVGNRAGEATTLNHMAEVYQAVGQPKQALKLLQQTLPITREVGNRAGEAVMLINMAYLLQSMHRYAEAQAAFEQSISLSQQVVNPAGEVAGLVGLALLLYQRLNHTEEAITQMKQAVSVLVRTGLPQDAGGSTLEDLQRWLQIMQQEGAQGGSSS